MRWIALAVTFFAHWLTSSAAFAETVEPTYGQVRETIPAGPFLAGAYAFIWAAVLTYVLFVARRLSGVRREIDDLRRRLERDAR